MPTWDAGQYLRFGDQRTRPCRELAERIALKSPRRVIDLGCGPGNSTAVLAERWPGAELTGLDSSREMIASAKKAKPEGTWVVGDIHRWAEEAGEKFDGKFDVVFSNAALQWVTDHGLVFGKLLGRVSPGGAMAMQMPGNFDAPAHVIMRQIAESPKWRGKFPAGGVREWHVHDLPFYYDVLSGSARELDLWETEYLHVLPDAAAIVEWYKGTGLRPFLDALASDELRKEYLQEYLEQIQVAYKPRSDGKVIFPFRRLFAIAYVRGD